MTDPSREPQSPTDVPGYGRVGEIDDPVPHAEYGDDREAGQQGFEAFSTAEEAN